MFVLLKLSAQFNGIIPGKKEISQRFGQHYHLIIDHWYMVTSSIFFYYISIPKRKNVLSLILLEIQKRKNRQMLCKSRAFWMCCISKSIRDRTLIDNQKIVGVTIYQ